MHIFDIYIYIYIYIYTYSRLSRLSTLIEGFVRRLRAFVGKVFVRSVSSVSSLSSVSSRSSLRVIPDKV